jgi:ApaG protein
MVTATTQGVKVSVIPEYQPEYSSPGQSHFVFSYRVLIENHSDYTVQLLRRHWFIFDTSTSRPATYVLRWVKCWELIS